MSDMIDFNSPVEVINGKRRHSALTADGNRLVGKIDYWLATHPGFHPPSKVARGVKATTWQADAVLSWLDDHGLWVVGDGNGCWRKYASKSPY